MRILHFLQDSRFAKVASEVLGAEFNEKRSDISGIGLEADPEAKGRLLMAMEKEFGGHNVPNSLLHTMKSLDHVFHFYSTRVDVR